VYTRDLLLGILLIGGAGWIASGGVGGPGGVVLGVAVGGCALAGGVYLLSGIDAGVDRRVAGRPLTRLRLRAVALALLGVSMLALGGDGYVSAGSGSPLLVAAGLAVLGIAVVSWTRPVTDDADHPGSGHP